jgi:glycosyltransferase involved in cell wall biosynthesis
VKVAIVSSTFLPAHEGVSISLLERLKKLSQLGHSALCLVSGYRELQHIYPNWSDYVGNILDNVEVVSLPSQQWMGVERERNPMRRSIPIIDRALKQFQPDIIQIEEPERLWTTMFTLPGLAYAKRHNIPAIASYRTNFIDYIPDYTPWWGVHVSQFAVLQLTKWIYNQYSSTLVGSKFIARRLESWGINNIDYARVIGSTSRLDPAKQFSNPTFGSSPNFWQQYELPEIDNTVKILFLGRLSPDKNWKFNCKYLPQLNCDRLQKFSIIIAGQGELEADLQRTLSQHLPVFMLGEISSDHVLELLANVDLHVTSSLKETFGRTVQESLSVGTPVLAPDCDWTRNLITNNFNGILYEAQNGEDFIVKLTQLIEGTNERNLLQHNALANSRQINSVDPASVWIEYLEHQIQLVTQLDYCHSY